MAVQLVDNFDLSSKKPLDSRAYWETLAALQANRTVLMPDGFLAYVKDKECYYIMKCTNPADPSTYTWSEFKTGSSSSGSGSTTGPTYTAGDNVQISSDNKISATDTKYTLTADENNPMKIDLTNVDKATDKQSVEIPIHTTAVEGYPTPVGSMILFFGSVPPEKYLCCDGFVYNIADYPELSDYIKAKFKKVNYFGGDGETTFAVPKNDADYYESYKPVSSVNTTVPDASAAHTNYSNDLFTFTNDSAYNKVYHLKASYTNGNASESSIDVYVNDVSIATYSSSSNPSISNTFTLKPGEKVRLNLHWPNTHYNDSVATIVADLYETITRGYCIKCKSDVVINNVYSTDDDTVIGRWIDGKPIYRKVIKNPTNNMDLSALSIENIINIKYLAIDNSNNSVIGYGAESSRMVYVNAKTTLKFAETFSDTISEVVLEYTKTTDDADTIPAGSHPSTYTEYSTVATDEEVEAALA